MANFSAPLSTYKLALCLQNTEQTFTDKKCYEASRNSRGKPAGSNSSKIVEWSRRFLEMALIIGDTSSVFCSPDGWGLELLRLSPILGSVRAMMMGCAGMLCKFWKILFLGWGGKALFLNHRFMSCVCHSVLETLCWKEVCLLVGCL